MSHRLMQTGMALLMALAAMLLGLSSPTTLSAEVVSSHAVPQQTPERILLSWSGDPAHTQAVTWRTPVPVETPVGQIVPWSADPNFGERAVTVPGSGETVSLGDATVGEYRLEYIDLQAATDYGYRVGDGNTWSEWFRFRTASEKPEPFRFIYVGDAQNDIRSMWSRTVRAAYAQAPDARLILHAGDLVAEGYDDALWGEWCAALGFIGATVPNVPVPGNHDMHRAPTDPNPDNVRSVAGWWHRRFVLPSNGPQGNETLRGEAYYIDFQGVRFVSVNSNCYANDDFEAGLKSETATAQSAWLEGVLANNSNRWTIVSQHHPIYSVGKDRDNTALRDALVPLYDKYHVDLVLQGHDHHYGRTQKLCGNAIVDPAAPGTIYVVSVSGPKMYPRNPKFEPLMAKLQGDTQMYQVIDVDNDRLALRAYSITGELVDAFELTKDSKGATVLRDVTPIAAGFLPTS